MIEAAWQRAQPGVPLTILPPERWDGGYSNDPPEGVDVYVFDAIFFNYFAAQGWLLPLQASEIDDIDDFVSYAIGGVRTGDAYYAIPMLGCTNILFYWDSDAQLDEAGTLDDIYEAVGGCPYTSQIPPDPRGLMVDMAGGTTNACLYIDATASTTGVFPVPQPWSRQEVNPDAMSHLREMLTMASYFNGTEDPGAPYQRARWFSDGHGRAVVGFTESMSAMSPAALARLAFKVMPLSDRDSRPLFYSDVIGIHPNAAKQGKRALAVQLANLLASAQIMTASLGPDQSGGPQYLMPTRHAVFDALAKPYPIYGKMHQLVNDADPLLFTLDAQARTWLNTMKGTLQSMVVEGYPCGCDFDAGPIWSQQDAERKCPPVCSAHGGWNGQWTTTQPGRDSVCGCNACPIE